MATALTLDRLLNWPIPEIEQRYDAKDTILYALGLGLGGDPLDRRQLRFVYDEGLAALPTLPVVLGYPGFWLKDPALGADWKRVLHGEQGLTLHAPLPASGHVIGRTRILDVVDRGPEKGLFLYQQRDVVDAGSQALICSLAITSVLRGDGGIGGTTASLRRPHAVPERAPDRVVSLQTLPQAALIYRLSGDDNPLHADPEVAAAAGYPRPILHGLCTYGVAGHAVLRACCDYDAGRLRRLDCRFTAPVYPGETIETSLWVEGQRISFTARAVERDLQVLGNGLAEID